MTTDDKVKIQIDDLKKRWTDEGLDADQRPGSVKLWVPIDNNTKIRASVSGRFISFLGVTQDEFGTTHTQVLTSDKASEEGREVIDTFYTEKGRRIGRRVSIRLATPVASPTSKDAGRVIKRLTLRVPQLMSVDSINYFLYNVGEAASRPISFNLGADREYLISNIDKAKLGALPAKYGTKAADTQFISN
jgi:hypothetical protein